MIYAPRMLLIGSTGRNSGKTALATAVIRRLAPITPVIAVKVTAVDKTDGQCPRGGAGCGVCSSLEGDYCITREDKAPEGKDTQLLHAAGALHTFWLRALKTRLEEGARELMKIIGNDAWVVCESNSLRNVLQPGLFVMVTAAGSTHVKPSAAKVRGSADVLAIFDGKGFDIAPEKFVMNRDRWIFENDTV